MPRYEYKVVPAPTKAGKIKGIKGTDRRFAAALAAIMNEMGADGWEYQRTDTLPCEERQGLTGKTTTFQNMLVFKRTLPDATPAEAILAIHESIAELPAPRDAEPAEPAAARSAEPPAVAVPAFRSGQNQLRPAAEGNAPKLGAARHPEPAAHARAPAAR